jgi:DNA-directed RNA polymerase specialized sigma24 family protein
MQEVYERVLNGADPDRVYSAWGFLKLDRVRRDRSRMTREHQPIQGDDDFHDDGVGSLERIHLAREELELLHHALQSLSPRMVRRASI